MKAAVHLPDASEIHVHSVRLAASEKTLRLFQSFLSEEERLRAERFAFPRLRTRFTLAQGALRLLLSHFTLEAPRRLRFSLGSMGKPALLDSAELHFNKSHSADLVLIAMAKGCDVGVDVEQLREVTDAEQIAARYFSPAENADLLREEDPQERRTAFLRCWTRKEAYVKAVGGGLSIPLHEFDVTLSRLDEPRISRLGGDGSAAAAWSLEHLEPAEGYIGALAYAGPRRRIRIHGPVDCDSLLERMSAGQTITGAAAEDEGSL